MLVFFIRSPNDIDHLTPIVDRLARGSAERVLVLCLNPLYDLGGDYRLRHLASFPNVTVRYAVEQCTPSGWHRVLARTLCKTWSSTLVRPLRLWERVAYALTRPWQKLLAANYSRVSPILQRRLYTVRWARELLQDANASLVVFDWAKPYQHGVGTFLDAAKALGVSTIALPHGCEILVGELQGAAARKAGTIQDLGARLPYDAIVVPHEDQRAYYERCGVDAEKLTVLGSARFCREWRTILDDIVPSDDVPLDLPGPRRLRVLVVDKPSANRADSVAKMLAAIGAEPELDVVLQPAPRGGKTTLEKVPAGIRLSRANSVRLIQWADVILGTVSSILLEVLLRNRLLVCPHYVSGVETVFTTERTCVLVHCNDELLDILRRVARGAFQRPYSDEQVSHLIERLIYGGRRDRDVLSDYAAYLARLRSRPSAVSAATNGVHAEVAAS